MVSTYVLYLKEFKEGVGTNPVKDLIVVSLRKKLCTNCLVLVGSRNRFESASISFKLASQSK